MSPYFSLPGTAIAAIIVAYVVRIAILSLVGRPPWTDCPQWTGRPAMEGLVEPPSTVDGAGAASSSTPVRAPGYSEA